MRIIGDFFGMIMSLCYGLVNNYGWTIILFTLFSKIILLPIAVMVQKNSIKMVKMYPEMNRIKAKCYGNKDMISEEEYHLYKREHYHPMLELIPVVLQLLILMGVVDGIRRLDVQDKLFAGFDLSVVPSVAGGAAILVPILAALSAWLMCFTQNKSNVLQSEQGKVNKAITLLVSVGLSLYLGFFVEAGIGLYWIASNLLSIVQMYILNYLINPQKYIDYAALEESKKELEKINLDVSKSKRPDNKELAAREKQDYRRFMKYENKQLVFYSEKNGFYKYFQNVIELILKKTDIVIHYITSDPDDEVFRLQNESFRVYYIGENKLIILMMKMDADMVVLTMPDLQKYHIKRSMVRNDIEYVYMDHGIGSLNMMLREHALDYFDTIFASNDIVYQEMRRQEEVYGLKPRNILKYGYGLIDNMIAAYEKQEQQENDPRVILIAPSWQADNIMDSCIDIILENLTGHGYRVILRPHPQYVRHFEGKLKQLENKYAGCGDFILQTDFSSNDTVFNADVLITDWSGIAYEYSFTTLKPTLFINTPMKIMNPEYKEINVEPFDIIIRNQIGISLDINQLKDINEVVLRLFNDETYSKESMRVIRNNYLYNVSKSGEVGAEYIIKRLIEYSKK